MNNRQAGAFRELVRKEERAREKWNEANLGFRSTGPQYNQSYNPQQYSQQYSQQFSATAPTQGGFQVQGSAPPSLSSSVDLSAPAAHAIYDQAIRISSPRLVDDGELNVPRTVQRRVVRQVEVPYTRTVKVPVKTRKIVPVVVQKKVRTNKLVEVPSWTTADEEYTEIVEQPAIRQREIWVKKLVPEKYIKKVEVKKSRKVKVPTTILKPVEDYEIVEVTENKAVEVDGFRVDQVEDSKLVEVEEFQTYELHPQATGESSVLGTREIGPVRGAGHHSRRIGNEVYHPLDERTRDIEQDEAPDDIYKTRGNSIPNRSLPPRGSQSARHAPRAAQVQPQNYTQASDTNSLLDAPTSQDDANSAFTSKIGFRVKNTNQNGVVVYRVAAGEAAERAGLHVSDVIIYANNKPTRNLTEFRSVVNNSTGPIYVQVRRRGGQKLLLTVHR